MKKNIVGSLKLIAATVLITGAYWLSYGMSGPERKVHHAQIEAQKAAVAAAEAECKSGAGICKSPATILRESREAGAMAAETVQAQLNQEAIARGQKPTVSRAGAKQPVVSAVAGAVVQLPNLKGPRKFAALIIDDQYDFMELPFTENALGGGKPAEKGSLAVGQADQAMLDDTVQFLSGWQRNKIFSQDWHPAGHVSHNTSFKNIKTGEPAPLFAPLGEAVAKEYKAVGAPGVAGGCVGVDATEADMTGKVAVNPSQVMWPVHCVQGTVGAEIPNDLFKNRSYAAIKSKKIADGLYGDPTTGEYIVEKGYHCSVDSYSAFLDVDKKTQTALFKFAAGQGITDIAIMGIANDYCVGSSAEDAINGGLNVHYIGNLSRGVDPAGMVKKFQHLSKLRGPNGARLVFYDLRDINDKDYSKNLLTKAGLWPITEKMTTAQFYALVDAIEGVAKPTPVAPVVAPVVSGAAPEELMPLIPSIETQTPIKSVEAMPVAVTKTPVVSPATKELTPTAPTYIDTPKEEPSFGWSEEEEETLVPAATEKAAEKAASLEKKYEDQKSTKYPNELVKFEVGTRSEAGNYVEISYGSKGQVFMKQPDGGYKIEFKDRQWELDKNGKVKSGGALLAPAAPISSAPLVSAAEKNRELYTQYQKQLTEDIFGSIDQKYFTNLIPSVEGASIEDWGAVALSGDVEDSQDGKVRYHKITWNFSEPVTLGGKPAQSTTKIPLIIKYDNNSGEYILEDAYNIYRFNKNDGKLISRGEKATAPPAVEAPISSSSSGVLAPAAAPAVTIAPPASGLGLKVLFGEDGPSSFDLPASSTPPVTQMPVGEIEYVD